MPWRTEKGSHYHMVQGCHGADILCDNTAGLAPCSDCCGKGNGSGGAPSSIGPGSMDPGGGDFADSERLADANDDAMSGYEGMYDPSMPVKSITETKHATVIEHENGIMEAVVDSSFIEGMSYIPGEGNTWDMITVSFKPRYAESNGLGHTHYAYMGDSVSREMFERIVSADSIGREVNILKWDEGIKTDYIREDGGIPVETIPRGVLVTDVGMSQLSGAPMPSESITPTSMIASDETLTDVQGNIDDLRAGKPLSQPPIHGAAWEPRTIMAGNVPVRHVEQNQFLLPHNLTDAQLERASQTCREEYVRTLGSAIAPTDTIVPYVSSTSDGLAIRYGFYSSGGIYDWTMENGGISLSFSDGTMPSDGYMVALIGPDASEEDKERRVLPLPARRPDENEGAYRNRFCREIESYVARNSDVLTANAWYLGTWVDEEGVCYIEMSERIPDRNEAVVAGRRRNQKKIWDVANMDEIDTGGTGML